MPAHSAAVREWLYRTLRERLERRHFRPGECLPGELALARAYEVSRGTVRAVHRRLEREGWIVVRRGQGAVVLDRSAEHGHAEVQWLLDDLEVIARRTRVELLRYEYTPAPPPARKHDPRFGRRALLIERVRSHRDEKFALVRHFVAEHVAHLLSRRRLRNRVTAVAFEAAGVSIGKGMQDVGAIGADEHSARALAVPLGAPLPYVRRFIRDAAGRLIEYQEALYRADRYRIPMGIEWDTRPGKGKHWAPIALEGPVAYPDAATW